MCLLIRILRFYCNDKVLFCISVDLIIYLLCRLFLGNPGDYAWGREGLDAIVTQLLNQMDGTGPPPLAKEKIDKIPTVVITEDQVRK